MAPPKSNEPGYCYSIDHPSSQPPQPLMLPPPPPNYPSALPSQAPYVAQQAKPPTPSQTPIDPLEQRILDLLYPYRDECFRTEDGTIVARERIALILCENIAFLIRHNQSSYGKHVDPNDVSIASRNWQAMKSIGGEAGIGIFVNGNGSTHTVVRITINAGESVLDRFTTQVDHLLQMFFPEV